jgi:hypothetical protein
LTKHLSPEAMVGVSETLRAQGRLSTGEPTHQGKVLTMTVERAQPPAQV